jgi:dienelactone hydrolase
MIKPRTYPLLLSILCLGLALSHSGLRSQTVGPQEPTAATTATTSTPTHSEAFTSANFEWRDLSRERDVPTRLHWPTNAQQPVGLIVFSHGIGGSRHGYKYLGEHWASLGYAALHVQHVGSDRSLWFGNPFGLPSRLQNAAQDSEAIDRVRDLRFALDQLLASPQGEKIDATRIIVAGHSYGANTALLASGARVERKGQVLDFKDPRFSAAVIVSAPPFYGETDWGKILQSIAIPTLHITATEDVIRVPGYYSGAQDRVNVYEATGSKRKWLAVFSGGSHSMFTDRMGTGGNELNPQVKKATRDLSIAFFKQVFNADHQGIASWSATYRDLLAKFEMPKH